MKTKIYTATIVADCVNGKTPISSAIQCASFASSDERQKWVDEQHKKLEELYGTQDEDYYAYEEYNEQEIDVPVFVCVNVDYKETDENCGLMTEAYATKKEAVEHLKESVREEVEAGTIAGDEIDWHTHNGKYGIANMPDDPVIADTTRFGWTIEEY